MACCSLPSLLLLLLLFLILPSTPFLECGRRGAAGRPRRRLGGGSRGGPLFMPVWRRPFPTSGLGLRQLRPGSLWPLSGLGPCSRAGPEASGLCSGPGASGPGLGLARPGAFRPCSRSGPGLLVLAPGLGLGASARRGDASSLLH